MNGLQACPFSVELLVVAFSNAGSSCEFDEEDVPDGAIDDVSETPPTGGDFVRRNAPM